MQHVAESGSGAKPAGRLPFLPLGILLGLCLSIAPAFGSPDDAWRHIPLPFRATNITSVNSTLWVCGTNEMLAVSEDGGASWRVKHQKPGGAVLLNIGFADAKAGYAAGSNGLVLLTKDGGESWVSLKAGTEPILQVAFSDEKHGMIRTPLSVELTDDGGARWKELTALRTDDSLKKWRYVFALATLDAGHSALMLKQGPEQASAQLVFFTRDAGQIWQAADISNVTLYSLVVSGGEYWALGTEFIDKDKPGGGYGVPVALHSADGEKWNHAPRPLQVPYDCNARGCLPWNGALMQPFQEKPAYATYPADKFLTAKWAVAASAICSVGAELRCAKTEAVQALLARSRLPAPAVVTPPILGAHAAGPAPDCLDCPFETVLADPRYFGRIDVEVQFAVKKDGTVGDVAVSHTPTWEIRESIKNVINGWLFQPATRNRIAVEVTKRVKLNLMIVHPPG